MKTNPVKGCLDYLPKEMELRQQIIETILETYKNNGFLQVETKKRLEELGYKVTVGYQYNETYYSISW